MPRKIILYTFSAVFFCIGLFGFMQLSWLLSTPLTGDVRAELSRTMDVPDHARAYAVNHGNPLFFRERPQDNPEKTAILLIMLFGGIGTSTGINLYIVLKQRKYLKQAEINHDGNG